MRHIRELGAIYNDIIYILAALTCDDAFFTNRVIERILGNVSLLHPDQIQRTSILWDQIQSLLFEFINNGMTILREHNIDVRELEHLLQTAEIKK
jgi:hypothetical protein